MRLMLLLLVLPVFGLATIEVGITAGENSSQITITTTGTSDAVISHKERETFQLTDENLKSSINTIFGRRPDDVFVKSPTPWGDLYVTNGWKQVTRTLEPISSNVQPIKNTTILVQRQIFNNTSSRNSTVHAKVWQTVEDTVTSKWQWNNEITASQDFKYGIAIKAATVSGETFFSYNSKWGESVEKFQKVTVGSESAVDISLQPYQSVIVDLYANKGLLSAKVVYQATLSGTVAVNYADVYKDHHFWNFDVYSIIDAGGFPKTALSSEEINLGYFISSHVNIRDGDTNEPLFTRPMMVFHTKS